MVLNTPTSHLMVEWRALVLALLIASAPALVNSQALPSAWTTGIATFYGGAPDGMDPNSPSFGTKDGSCGYGMVSQNVYPYWSVAALSTSNQFAIAGPSDACGQCFEIQCVNSGGPFAGRCTSAQSVTVTITDSCPECEANHIDIQALTFAKIAPASVGRIDIQYRRVDCTPPLPVSVAIDNNAGVGGWLRLVVEKTAGFGGITAVSIRNSGTTWAAMTNKFGSAWEVSNTPQLPWDFQFTSDSGQSIVANNLVQSNGQIGSIPTGVQFSLSGSTGGSAISYDGGAGGGSPPSTMSTLTTPPAQQAQTPPAGGLTPSTPPPTLSTSPGSCPCNDVAPTSTITCAQQQAYGKCDEVWMTGGNFCQQTCGRCPASCPAGSGSSSQSSTTTPPASSSTPTPPAPSGSSQTTQTQNSTPPSPTSSGGSAGQNYITGGTVQTQSIESSGGCSDTPPSSGQSCATLAAVSGACGSSLQQGTCDKSCYRC